MQIIQIIQSFTRETTISPAIFAVVLGMSGASAANAADTLSANDVSWLFPAPAGTSDLANLISIEELKGSDGNPLVSDDVFAQYVTNAESNATAIEQPGVGTFRIRLPSDAKLKKNWHIAGLRIDPAAPGTSDEIIKQYGRTPQLRLVVQPIDNNGKPFDIAGHFVFNITLATQDPPAEPGCAQRNKADDDAFKKIVADFADLKKKLAAGDFGEKIETGGPLGVHPGLASGKTKKALRDALKGMLESNLSGQRLSSMAVMGLEDPEPWIFLATIKLPNGKFFPAPGVMLDGKHQAEMLSRRSRALEVFPRPVTNNLNPITCRNGATSSPPLAPKDRNGVSTAQLFGRGALTGQAARDVADRIANTNQSHFFNTDCVSCHTETRRPMSVLGDKSFDGIRAEVLPQEDWNVRNFGWFTSFLEGGPVRATVTRRTQTETAAVLNFINNKILK